MKPIHTLIFLACLVPGCGCGSDGDEEIEIRITGTAEPLTEVADYGQVVLCRFSLKNENDFPLFIHRAETLEGYRITLADLARPLPGAERMTWVHSGLLLPGQELRIEAPYRVLAPEERILLTVRPATMESLLRDVRFLHDGEWVSATEELVEQFARTSHPTLVPPISDSGRAVLLEASSSRKRIPEVMAVVALPCPEAPFDPWARGASGKAWTWSGALEGYVFRPHWGDAHLIRADWTKRLPTVPFEFFRDVDYREEGVTVIGRDGVRHLVRAEDLMVFLADLRSASRRIEFGEDPEQPGETAYVIR